MSTRVHCVDFQCPLPYRERCTAPFCTPNRRLFIWFRHIAIDSVTISLGLNRGSHYKLVHTCLTKRTTVWLGSYNRQRAFNFGRGFSIVKVECPLSIIRPKSYCGALRHSSVHLSKKTVPFPDYIRVTKSIAMCRIEMKRCRFGVQNGVCRYEATFAGVVSQLRPMQSADLRWTDADSQWEKVYNESFAVGFSCPFGNAGHAPTLQRI